MMQSEEDQIYHGDMYGIEYGNPYFHRTHAGYMKAK